MNHKGDKECILPEALKGISTNINMRVFNKEGETAPDDIERKAAEAFLPVQNSVPPMPGYKKENKV